MTSCDSCKIKITKLTKHWMVYVFIDVPVSQADVAPPMEFPIVPSGESANLPPLFPNASMNLDNTAPPSLFNLDGPNFMMNNITNNTSNNSSYTTTQSLLQQLMDDNFEEMNFSEVDLANSKYIMQRNTLHQL